MSEHAATTIEKQASAAPSEPRPGSKGTVRVTAAYTLGNALQRGLSFLLLPFFTRAVTPAEYGQLSVAFSITGVAAVLMAFGFDFAVYRTFFQLAEDPPAQRRYVHTAWTFLTVVPIGMAVLGTLVSLLFLDGSGLITPLIMLLALMGAATSIAATRVPFGVLRAEQRLRPFMIISVGSAIVTSLATVLAVVVLHTGVIGWLTAVVVANVLELGLAVWVVPYRPSERFERRHLVSSLRLGIPLVPHYLSQWALQLADRLLLATLVGGAALGVYSLGANLAVPVMVLVSSVSQALMPTYARAANDAQTLRKLPSTITLQVNIVALITLVAAVLAPPVVDLLAPHQYEEAAVIAPWIVLGYGFMGLYSIPMALAGLTMGRTKHIWMITLGAAAINLGLIWTLVPSDGIEAAAVASAVGYAALLVGVYFYAQHGGSPVAMPWSAIGITTLTCLVVYAACELTAQGDSAANAIIRIAWAGVGTVAIATLAAGSPRLLAARVRGAVRRQLA